MNKGTVKLFRWNFSKAHHLNNNIQKDLCFMQPQNIQEITGVKWIVHSALDPGSLVRFSIRAKALYFATPSSVSDSALPVHRVTSL